MECDTIDVGQEVLAKQEKRKQKEKAERRRERARVGDTLVLRMADTLSSRARPSTPKASLKRGKVKQDYAVRHEKRR